MEAGKMSNALVIIDVQEYFLNEYTEEIPEKISNLIKDSSFDYIIFFKYVSSLDEDLEDNTHVETPSELRDFTNKDNIFYKSTYSAFKSDKFKNFLGAKDINKIFLCGLDTDGCVLATAFEGYDLNYEIRIIEDLCASHHGKQYHKYGIEILKKKLGKDIIIKRKNIKGGDTK